MLKTIVNVERYSRKAVSFFLAHVGNICYSYYNKYYVNWGEINGFIRNN